MTGRQRLVDVGRVTRREARSRCTDLVPVENGNCPRCGEPLDDKTIWQDTLLRGGGYGGTRRIESQTCSCGFERVVAVATERPPRVIERAS